MVQARVALGLCRVTRTGGKRLECRLHAELGQGQLHEHHACRHGHTRTCTITIGLPSGWNSVLQSSWDGWTSIRVSRTGRVHVEPIRAVRVPRGRAGNPLHWPRHPGDVRRVHGQDVLFGAPPVRRHLLIKALCAKAGSYSALRYCSACVTMGGSPALGRSTLGQICSPPDRS